MGKGGLFFSKDIYFEKDIAKLTNGLMQRFEDSNF